MAIDLPRRRLLKTLAALSCGTPATQAWTAVCADTAPPSLLTCWSDSPTRPSEFHAGLLGVQSPALALPARGHDIAWHPSADGSAVVVARRPGDFLVRWHVPTGVEVARFEADDESRFEGHIAFRPDGRVLYATETDLITGDGRIGVFDALSLERLDAWPCGGVGPHAVEWMADGRLAVAVGGILTLPETGRVKRNLASMDPSLTFLDPGDGQLLSQHRLPDAFMSVRHIAQDAGGGVAVSLQNEGRTARPLFALLDGRQLRYGEADADLIERCGDYAGDIIASNGGFAVSCTRAGVTATWSADGKAQAVFATRRVCAMAEYEKRLVVTGDEGDLWQLGIANAARNEQCDRHWQLPVALDNHACGPATAHA
ncbi:DUF1513 domain-containing protein [Thauera linaloolentis]|uniref:Twin-arginine translocation pathway signal n=1 Tax=Thauera linaloolentis (strain DSM 12138 / JCM 21573 / CCUG 41526 / CIP 105981 / IAM 15112 / NBRC 102519 / 47Lol) TaxID=1123367 RepID=N6Z2P6_THAL4|nr:DUF1513 domain-containing protein [Thauera linaloolentis]ENO88653.1 twin-arginine translocation pathway signal [Thauera linaloolentis 47Lol = DSM 12138]MCM8565698.1 DUF1513 domain-containing protein [Thauera linaloolentis]